MFIDAKEPFDREVLRFEGWRVWCRRAIIGDTGIEVDMGGMYVPWTWLEGWWTVLKLIDEVAVNRSRDLHLVIRPYICVCMRLLAL
jgi:hypothetical protein